MSQPRQPGSTANRESTRGTGAPVAGRRAWSVRTADTILSRHPLLSNRWHYEPGTALLAVNNVYRETRERRYLDYIQHNIDQFVTVDGDIRTYRLEEYNLDQINEGKLLFLLHDATGDERYRRAAFLLGAQLETHPRTGSGGFWHKQIYPHQMWLDGIYMALPFCAEFASRCDRPEILDDVARQIVLIEKHTRDPRTGLLFHAWDESRSQRWADPDTGCSPSFWGRAVGWYTMAIPDVLDHFPDGHPDRERLVAILKTTVSAIVRVQDPASGLWYQVLDQGGRPGNYLECSASCMFVFAIAKGVRMGYIDNQYIEAARKGYQGILDRFVATNGRGMVSLRGTCAVAGLGGEPYRDGSFEYYVSEKTADNDLKGVGPFVMASIEMENLV